MKRVVGSVVVSLLAALLLGGCAAEPDPTPTPPALFATDEEAFAAAEATYRAYVDALNQVDLSDPETFEAVYAWTTGDPYAADRENLTRMHADGWRVGGRTSFVDFEGTRHLLDMVDGSVCLNVGSVTLINADGESMVSEDRPEQSMYDVGFVGGMSPTGLVVATIEPSESSCGP